MDLSVTGARGLRRRGALNFWPRLNGAGCPPRPSRASMISTTPPSATGGSARGRPHLCPASCRWSYRPRPRRRSWCSNWGRASGCGSRKRDSLNWRPDCFSGSTPPRHAELPGASESVRGHGAVRFARQLQRAVGRRARAPRGRSPKRCAVCLWQPPPQPDQVALLRRHWSLRAGQAAGARDVSLAAECRRTEREVAPRAPSVAVVAGWRGLERRRAAGVVRSCGPAHPARKQFCKTFEHGLRPRV